MLDVTSINTIETTALHGFEMGSKEDPAVVREDNFRLLLPCISAVLKKQWAYADERIRLSNFPVVISLPRYTAEDVATKGAQGYANLDCLFIEQGRPTALLFHDTEEGDYYYGFHPDQIYKSYLKWEPFDKSSMFNWHLPTLEELKATKVAQDAKAAETFKPKLPEYSED